MDLLLELAVKDIINSIQTTENIKIDKDKMVLNVIHENDNRCLARVWDNERCCPNLRCSNRPNYNGLCLTHFKMGYLPFKLITETPSEMSMLRIYRKHNPNVDNEIIVFKKNDINLITKLS